MPIRGLRSHPVEGVKAAKKRLPKLPRAPEADDLQEQSSIYLKERNKAMRLKRMREEMLLAKERGRLIERRLVERQLAYFLIAIRQKLMGLPARLYSRLGEERFPKEAAPSGGAGRSRHPERSGSVAGVCRTRLARKAGRRVMLRWNVETDSDQFGVMEQDL